MAVIHMLVLEFRMAFNHCDVLALSHCCLIFKVEADDWSGHPIQLAEISCKVSPHRQHPSDTQGLHRASSKKNLTSGHELYGGTTKCWCYPFSCHGFVCSWAKVMCFNCLFMHAVFLIKILFY